MSVSCAKFHVCGFGFALGLTIGLMTFVTGLLAITGYGVAFVELMSSVYLGYAATFWGSVLGFLWGFLDGFIIGVLFAYFYNWCCCMCSKYSKSESETK